MTTTGLPIERRRILVAANGSEQSYSAVSWARHIAASCAASVAVVDVAEADDREMDPDESVAHLEQIRERLRAHLAERGVPVAEVIVEHGSVCDVIARHADDVALTVVGARGDEASSRRSVEIVTELARVLDHPIAVVPYRDLSNQHDQSHTNGPIVVGVDGSQESDAVFHWACWFADQLEQPVIAVHVVDPLYRTFTSADQLSAQDLAVRREVMDSGAEFVERVDEPPGEALAAYAAIRGAGALVVGARVRHSLGGRLLGGVTLGAVESARCPVVVVPRTYQIGHRPSP